MYPLVPYDIAVAKQRVATSVLRGWPSPIGRAVRLPLHTRAIIRVVSRIVTTWAEWVVVVGRKHVAGRLRAAVVVLPVVRVQLPASLCHVAVLLCPTGPRHA